LPLAAVRAGEGSSDYPSVEAKTAEDPKAAERKTANLRVGRKSARKTNSAKCS
jgi:hypothetical protein